MVTSQMAATIDKSTIFAYYFLCLTMPVDIKKPHHIVYAFINDEHFGTLLEALVFQAYPQATDQLMLEYQALTPQNIGGFAIATEEDVELVKLISETHPDAVLKKVKKEKEKVKDYFKNIYKDTKANKLQIDVIDNYIEKRKKRMYELLKTRKYIVKNKNAPNQFIEMMPGYVDVQFHFKRYAVQTTYFATLTYNDEPLDIRKSKTVLLANSPGFIWIDNAIYALQEQVEGVKLKPFMVKENITISSEMEETYYKGFVANMIAEYDIVAEGFTVINVKERPRAVLQMKEMHDAKKALIFAGDEEEEIHESTQLLLQLTFQYGRHSFTSFNEVNTHVVYKRLDDDTIVFYKIHRDKEWEIEAFNSILATGLKLVLNKIVMPRNEALRWINTYLNEEYCPDIVLDKGKDSNLKYFLGKIDFSLNITENRDWFDVNAVVMFGEFRIPFAEIRRMILNKQSEFKLPSGEVAIIPSSWFVDYTEFFAFAKEGDDNESVILARHHLALVQEMKNENLAAVTISNKLEALRDFTEIENTKLPKGLKGTLRPYQKGGYDWMRFLNTYHLGGCLADDMGLGKTVQTLALLQEQREEGKLPSLLIVPTSLIYNWQMEAAKFVPSLLVMAHVGQNRKKHTREFMQYNLIITSYGTLRSDLDLLSGFKFNYVILDESQAIKNPTSLVSKAVMELDSRHRLILTGTPLENSTLDLWSQMNFINPGLLGSQSYFKNEFQIPIEKKNDEEKLKKLHNIIKPFILRRSKSQVATDLPPKIENLHYSTMSESQAKAYETAKDYYRTQIMEQIELQGIAKSQFFVLQGLTHLRQLANHPRMVDEDYLGDSGKLEDVTFKLCELVQEGHKVLVFSQFVKQLKIVEEFMNELEIPYAYLDGGTKDRQAEVESFQNDEKIQVFLISLKAGGVGLNLTAADYVFLLDPWWNPAIEAQAVDRAHRIGQNKTVMIYKFISRDTIEEKILLLQQNKRKLISDLIITEESFMKNLTQNDIAHLLQ